MLSITAVSDADYYLRAGSGCGGGKDPSGSAAEYELEAVARGEPPGEWLYPHRNDFGVEGEIHPENESGDQFRRVVNNLQHPLTGAQLGRTPPTFASVDERMARFDRKHPDATPEQRKAELTRAESKHRHANHAWDMTFSATKSVSVLHAALEHEDRHDEAEQVKAAMRAGIEAALTFAADELGHTRRGTAGPEVAGRTTMRHVRDGNFQTALFLHHTSRDRDPQLHAHVMLVNRILCDDGQWRALYSPALLKNKHMLDAIFQRVLEAELTERLGSRFAARPDGKAREVVGVSPQIRDLFSARSRAVDTITEEDLTDWRKVHGDEDPPALIKWRIQRRAVLKSRKGKLKDSPTREQDVKRWDAEIAQEFREGFAAVCEEVDIAAREPASSGDFDPVAVIQLALDDLTQRKSTWNRSHLMHAISQHLPDMLRLPPGRVVDLLVELSDAALDGRQVFSLGAPAPVEVPATLKDPKTGESVFEAPTGGRYTTRVHLAREDSLVNRLGRRGAPILKPGTAARALSGRGLSDEQMSVATSVLTSDRSVELVDAAAGTGKSRLMAALSDTSAEVWGHGLTGFAVAQNAAQVLQREGIARAHNIAAYLDFRYRERRGEVSDVERATFAVPRGGTVVVDEASMVSTPQLAELFRELDEAGVGRVVMIGDSAQVDAVDAGGAFRLLTREREAHTLTQVRRFDNEWEREASTRLRDGDVEALNQYEIRDRIHGGEPEDIERRVVDEFVTDYLSGLETVIVTSTGDKAADLSSEIRQRLVNAGRVEQHGVPLHDDTTAGAGDIIQTRWNNQLVGVVNREVWKVDRTDRDGHLIVRPALRDDRGRLTWGDEHRLPSWYVGKHVELAYASTVDAVQGRSVDAGATLFDDMMGASRLYPAQTRGRVRNTVWVPITPPARRLRESDEDYEARIPSPMAKLIAAYERDDHTEAARTVIREEQERATNMGHLRPQWAQLIAEQRAADHREMLREIVGTERHVLFADPAIEGVLHLMRSAEVNGYDVRAVVGRAYGESRLEGARTPGGLLFDKIDAELSKKTTQPREQVTRAETYAERTPVGDHPDLLFARGNAELLDAREAELGEQAAGDPPSWALALLGPAPDDPFHRASWQERVGVVAGYRESHGLTNAIDPIGRTPSKAEPEHRWEFLRASRALGADTERDVVEASDGELARQVLAWRREQEWMPRNVDDDLRETNDAAGYARGQVVQARTRGEDPSEWVRMLQDMEARTGRLEKVATARRAAVEHTAEPRDRAQEAMVEMRRRVERDRVVAEREAAKRAADERDRQAAADEDARVHGAVGERFREQWVPNAPAFGSERWAELDDDAPEKRASLFTAALSWWRMGEPRDERALTERLERHGADVAPERAMPEKALERVRGGEDEELVRRDYPTGDLRVLGEVHRYTGRDMEGDAPAFGTPEYADAGAEVKGKAETRAALAYHHAGDTLDERERRAEVEEERAGAREIAEDLKAEREQRVDRRTHRELAKARGEEPPEREPVDEKRVECDEAEPPARPDTSWVREAAKAKAPEREPEPRQEAPEPTPPARDDLDEQLDRARAAEERIRADRERVEGERRDSDRRDADRREQERSRGADEMQR